MQVVKSVGYVISETSALSFCSCYKDKKNNQKFQHPIFSNIRLQYTLYLYFSPKQCLGFVLLILCVDCDCCLITLLKYLIFQLAESEVCKTTLPQIHPFICTHRWSLID